MKEILVAGIIAALAIVTVESLNCTQCNSLSASCNNPVVSVCPGNVSSSCITSSVKSTLGNISSYWEKSCFSEECTEMEKVIANFTVRVSDKEHFSFASQCCQEDGCNANSTISASSPEGKPGNMSCSSCYGSNETSCTNESQTTCNQEERCVELVAVFENGTKPLVLKGCANVNEVICQFLINSPKTIGGITVQKFICRDAETTPSVPTSTQTTKAASSPTPPTTTPSSATKVSLIPLALASLLLLVLIL